MDFGETAHCDEEDESRRAQWAQMSNAPLAYGQPDTATDRPDTHRPALHFMPGISGSRTVQPLQPLQAAFHGEKLSKNEKISKNLNSTGFLLRARNRDGEARQTPQKNAAKTRQQEGSEARTSWLLEQEHKDGGA